MYTIYSRIPSNTPLLKYRIQQYICTIRIIFGFKLTQIEYCWRRCLRAFCRSSSASWTGVDNQWPICRRSIPFRWTPAKQTQTNYSRYCAKSYGVINGIKNNLNCKNTGFIKYKTYYTRQCTLDDSLWNNCSAAKYGCRFVIKNNTLELYKAGNSSCSSVLIRSNFRLTSSNCSLAFIIFASSFFLPAPPPPPLLLASWLLCLWLS